MIITEVGPGSDVSRLDGTQKLNETRRMAEEILAAAQNLSARAGTIIEEAESIDGTVSNLTNATEINERRTAAGTRTPTGTCSRSVG